MVLKFVVEANIKTRDLPQANDRTVLLNALAHRRQSVWIKSRMIQTVISCELNAHLGRHQSIHESDYLSCDTVFSDARNCPS